MKIPLYAAGVALAMAGAAAAAGEKMEIPLSEVPEEVKAAALQAKPGLELTEAEVEVKQTGEKVYEIEGVLNDVEYEIKVTGAGQVLGVEED